METLHSGSKLIVEFSLIWQSSNMKHEERFYADPVNLWRDVFEPAMIEQLHGKTIGASASIDIPASRFPEPSSTRKIVSIRPDQVKKERKDGSPIVLAEGRFYPQGLLQGVVGVYAASTLPCRYLGIDKGQLMFDLNHPLAGHDLRFSAKILAIQAQIKERGGRCEDWLEKISSNGPGMQEPSVRVRTRYIGDDGFTRRDDRPDSHFYQQPRMVHHLDSTCRQEISKQYAKLIRPGSKVLDLMGSWHSHLPEDLSLAGLSVLGMNMEELQRNSRANELLLQDLNLTPRLPMPSEMTDAVICTASIEYLIKPQEVMAEAARILKPGGVIAIAFSNRWFPHKVTAYWEDLHEFERLGMVAQLIQESNEFAEICTLTRRGAPRPDDDPHFQYPFSDPVFMVWAVKK